MGQGGQGEERSDGAGEPGGGRPGRAYPMPCRSGWRAKARSAASGTISFHGLGQQRAMPEQRRTTIIGNGREEIVEPGQQTAGDLRAGHRGRPGSR